MSREGEIHPFLLADYFSLFLVRAREDRNISREFLARSSVCAGRDDDALRYAPGTPEPPDSPNALTGLFDLVDTVPGARPDIRPLFNNLNGFPLCLAFTLGEIMNISATPLMYANGEAMLSIGNTIELSLGGASVTFNYDIAATLPTRAQICLDGSNAVLYINCTQVQSQPFAPRTTVVMIGVIAEQPNINNPYLVS